MKKERKVLKLSQIQLNQGQIDWLPRNPRQWTQEELENMKKSILEDEDFLEDRPALVVPLKAGQFVVFGGNFRTEGAREVEKATIPSIIYYPETEEDYATIKRRAMKDNGSFGRWDYDVLANEWDDLPLTDWGVPAWDTRIGVGDLEIEAPNKGGGGTGYKSITFTLLEADALIVNDYIKEHGKENLTNQIIELCRTQEAK